MAFITGIGFLELALLGLTVVAATLVAYRTSRRWWVAGFVACVAVAILNTPADPLSTLIVAVQCCTLYGFSAFAWRATGKTADAVDE